ncbi:MAG: family 2 glycosyl transferase [Rariglobus sp.]|jgi:glycosyltransferase involved in cell wall biosynthesis|nr:family 2 glycosyl transferase [Rariglobus sp.]
MTPALSAIICTYNPRLDFLARTLDGLRRQTLPAQQWELIIVDNRSRVPVSIDLSWHPSARIVVESQPGLTPARLRGIAEARGPVLVFIDDDNLLSPEFFSNAVDCFKQHPRLGAAGGPVRPEFEKHAPDWTSEFHGLLALHEHGGAPLIAGGSPQADWPAFAPVGAGLCVRREAAALYVEALGHDHARQGFDRNGRSLASGGDNDLVFTILHGGWDVGYFPALFLSHFIPPGRLEPDYLSRLNEGIQRSWVRVLHIHGRHPWRPIPRWTVPLRSARAWFRLRAWAGSANRVRWRGIHGRFLGQADINESKSALAP